jgi:hypothetical protein
LKDVAARVLHEFDLLEEDCMPRRSCAQAGGEGVLPSRTLLRTARDE